MLKSQPARFPERRRGIRILTRRNFAAAAVIFIVAFAVISIRSEMRDTTGGRYGRLYGKQVTKAAPELPSQAGVVVEAPATAVADQSHADPMLVAPAAREAYLGTRDQQFVPAAPAAEQATVYTPPPQQLGDVAIVGGADGVAVVSADHHAKPLLSGGFMRQ